MANKRIDQFDATTPDGDEWLLIQDPTTLGYNKASASSITGSTAYTKAQSDAALALKADQATTYTKIEVDASLAGKAETIHVHTIADTTGLQAALDGKQATLVSGTNIKTINGTSLLGSGDITITGGTGAVDSVNAQTGVVVLDADDISDAATTNKFVTAADKTKLSNLSGTNTGDQDLSGYSTTSHTHTLDNLSDVAITSPSTGQVLKYNGSGWVNDTDATAGGAGATNLTTTLSSTQTVIVSDTGTDAIIPAVDGTNAGVMTPTQKTKLDGIATSATANDTDANLKARANHTGTQSADTITDGTTNKAYTATEKTKLAGIATGATANTGDVVGPASSTDNAIARFDSTTGKLVQNSGLTVSDSAAGQITVGSSDAINIAPTGGAYINTSSADGIILTASATGFASGIALTAVDGGVTISNDNLQTNTISERTAASGVTIDGVLIKDGLVDGVDVSTLGSGSGDVVGPASSVSGNIATFSGTTGKLIQDGGKALPTGAIVGTSDSQTLTNKTLTTPTISSTGFTNAQHAHAGATSGGQIPIANTTGTLAVGRGGTGATTLTGILKGNGTSAVTAVTAPSGTIVGTTDTQTLTNKTLTTPLIDTINEATAAAGVTADGVLLKDGHVTVLGGAGAPATPATGYGKYAGTGTTNVRPKWVNESGTVETIVTDKDSTTAWQSWTPTVTPQTGSITSYTIGSAKYKQIEKTVHLSAVINITNAGTGGGVHFTLPINAANTAASIGYGRENAVTGVILQVRTTSATVGTVAKYDNSNACVTNYQLQISATYEAA